LEPHRPRGLPGENDSPIGLCAGTRLLGCGHARRGLRNQKFYRFFTSSSLCVAERRLGLGYHGVEQAPHYDRVPIRAWKRKISSLRSVSFVSISDKPAVSLLIIDDNLGSLDLLSNALARPGLEILTASDPEGGLDIFCRRHPQIVLTNLVMPHLTGIEVLERIMEIDPATDVIIMAAHYSSESAVEAIKKGASDYLNKPISVPTLRERVGKLIDEARKRQRSLRIEDELRIHSEFEGIVGRSPLMWEMFTRIQRVAPHYRTVLIIGGTGTGKDLAARALHRLSPVSSGRYVVLNCSARSGNTI
jgi:CheY-like chemotaxis protein